MKRVIVMMAFLMVYGSFAEESVPAPKLVITEPQFDFGTRPNTEVVEHSFELRNEGDAPLVITRVKASCGCTVAKLTSKEIAPGESEKLTAKLNLKGRRGRQNKGIRIQSNDPTQPSIMVFLKGTAVTEFDISPGHVHFGRVRSDSEEMRPVSVTSHTAPFTITSVSVDSEYFRYETDNDTHAQSHTINVYLVPPLPPGVLSQTMTVKTDHPKKPGFVIRLGANVQTALSVAPFEIRIRKDAKMPLTRYVIVRSNFGRPFKIESVEMPGESMSYEIQPMGNAGYRLAVKGIDLSMDLHEKSIIVRTDVEGESETSIPFFVE